MRGRGGTSDHEDPSVAPVEVVLDHVATRDDVAGRGVRPVAEHALRICACVSIDAAPTWLIYDTPDGTLRWCRIRDGAEASDLVDAHSVAGGHADPGSVLAWLSGTEAHPWAGGDGWGDEDVLIELGRRIVGR